MIDYDRNGYIETKARIGSVAGSLSLPFFLSTHEWILALAILFLVAITLGIQSFDRKKLALVCILNVLASTALVYFVTNFTLRIFLYLIVLILSVVFVLASEAREDSNDEPRS